MKNVVNVFTELFCRCLTSFGNIWYHLSQMLPL